MTIDIVNSDLTINSVFVKATAFLLEKHFEDFQEGTDSYKTELLEKLWLTEYKAVLLKENNQWSSISFNRKTDHTIFLLRWS
jgi:hypothetical protein